MESVFKKRFKSSMKISKNKSIFDTLIPIDKTINCNQIHEDFLKYDERSNLRKELLNYGILPPIVSPRSTKSTNRVSSDSRRTPFSNVLPKENSFTDIKKNNSPDQLRFKIENDIKRIMKSVEKKEEIFQLKPKSNRLKFKKFYKVYN